MISIPIVSEFNSAGISKAVKSFKQLETAGEKAQFAIKKAAVPAAAALTGIVAVLGTSVKAAIEDEAAQVQLANQLRQSTNATKQQIAEVEKYITKTSMASAVTDDKLRPALAGLLRHTKDVTRAQELANIALDVATATGKDYETVALAIGKAESGNYAALKKLGIPLGENALAMADKAKETKNLIKQQQAYNLEVEMYGVNSTEAKKALEKVNEAQRKVNEATVDGADYVKDLQAAFGGANKQFTDTAAGGMAKLNIAFAETKESVGAALMPAFEKLLPIVQKFAEWAQKNPELLTQVTLGIGGVAAATLVLNAAMATNPFVAFAAGLIAISVAMTKLADAADKLKGITGIGAKILGSIALPNFAGALAGNLIGKVFGKGPEVDTAATSVENIGRAGAAERAVNVTVNAGVGDPVAIGKSVVDALNAYKTRTGSFGLVGS